LFSFYLDNPVNHFVGWLSIYHRAHNESEGHKMDYKVLVHESDEGFSVSCPGLPGCWSQGKTEVEALANIQEAIREYLLVNSMVGLERA
jgi:hypothetical protein